MDYINIFCLFFLVVIVIILICFSLLFNYTDVNKNRTKLKYYLVTADFIKNMIEIDTANILQNSTNKSSYLSGRSILYDYDTNENKGNCSASFETISIDDSFINISNYISTFDGLIVTWFTPSLLKNLSLDETVNQMVTECITSCDTKIGKSLYYGKTFNMKVYTEEDRIVFELLEIQ